MSLRRTSTDTATWAARSRSAGSSKSSPARDRSRPSRASSRSASSAALRSGPTFAAGGSRRPAPLWATARWKRPAVRGEVISAATDTAPADSPITVTLPGSPPKTPACSATHSSTAT